MKNYKAIVIGATGGVGAYLVEKLIESSLCLQVTVISRRECPKAPKLTNIIWENFSDYLLNKNEENIEVFKNHDVLFCCLGAPEKAMIGLLFNKKKYTSLFQTVDYDFTVRAASAAFKAGVPQFSVVSSSGLSEKGTFPYIKIKWKMEQAIKRLEFKNLSIFQPSHLMKPAKVEEKFFKKIVLNFIAVVASKMPHPQKAITVESVAKAMLLEFETRTIRRTGSAYFTADDMRGIIKSSRN